MKDKTGNCPPAVTRASGDFRLDRRRLLLGAAATAGSLAAASAFPAPAIAQATKIKYTLSWLPTGQYSYVYLARSLGYWKKRGLDVDISRGYGSMAAVQAISTGQFDMGGAATGATLINVMRGLDMQMVGTQGYDSYMGFLVPADGPIKTPKDLAGKKVGVAAAGGDTPFIEAYLNLAGVDPKSVTIVSLDSQIIERSVIDGRVDCMVAFGMSSIPNFITQNFPVKLLPFSEKGLQYYWVNTIATQKYYEENAEIVENVQAGLMEGMKYMMLNPADAVKRHLEEHQEIAISDNGKLFTELGVGMISVCNTVEETMTHGLGYTDIAKIDAQGDLVEKYVATPEDPPVPAAKDFVVNLPEGTLKLSEAEWAQVKENSAEYAKLLGA